MHALYYLMMNMQVLLSFILLSLESPRCILQRGTKSSVIYEHFLRTCTVLISLRCKPNINDCFHNHIRQQGR